MKFSKEALQKLLIKDMEKVLIKFLDEFLKKFLEKFPRMLWQIRKNRESLRRISEEVHDGIPGEILDIIHDSNPQGISGGILQRNH